MITLIILFLTIVAGSVFLASYFDEPFEKTIPLSLMWIVFILLIAGVMDVLLYGLYFVIVIAAVLYVATIVATVRHGLKGTCKRVFTGTFFMFAIFFCIAFYANRGMVPHEWDEFTYWILAVKSLCLNDALYTHTHEEMISGYPQGVAAFQYMFSRLVMLGRKTDVFPAGAAYAALNVIQVSFVFPLIKKEYLDGIIMWIITIISVFCFPIFFYTNTYSVLVPDALLGITVGAGIATVVFTPLHEKKLLYHILVLSECAFMVVTKRTGFLLAAALAGAYLLDLFYIHKDNLQNKWKMIASTAFVAGLSILIPYAVFKWETIRDIKARNILYSFTNWEQGYETWSNGFIDKIRIAKSYFEEFFYESFEIGHLKSAMPFYLLIILGAVAIYCIYILTERQHSNQKYRIAIFGIYSYIVFFAWVLAFLYTYTFKLTDAEAGVLNSFKRYLTTGFMPVAYIILFGTIGMLSWLSGRKKRVASILLLVVLCTFIPMAEPLRFINGRYIEEAQEGKKKIEGLLGILSETNFDESDRIFFISQSDYGNRRNQICYYAYPVSVSPGPWCFSDGKYDSEDDYQENKMLFASSDNPQELKERWNKDGITYVLVQDMDEYFIDTFSSLFESGVPEENSLYKIEPNSGLLVKVR